MATAMRVTAMSWVRTTAMSCCYGDGDGDGAGADNNIVLAHLLPHPLYHSVTITWRPRQCGLGICKEVDVRNA